MINFLRPVQLLAIITLSAFPVVNASEGLLMGAKAFKANIGKGRPLVVKFGASWCPACKAAKPLFIAAAKNLQKEAVFIDIDVEGKEGERALSGTYGIRQLPTFIIFDGNGEEFDRTISGGQTLETQIKQKLHALPVQPAERPMNVKSVKSKTTKSVKK